MKLAFVCSGKADKLKYLKNNRTMVNNLFSKYGWEVINTPLFSIADFNKRLKEYEKSSINEFIFFYTGHGSISSLQQIFQLEVDNEEITMSQVLESIFKYINPKKQAILLDACYSGTLKDLALKNNTEFLFSSQAKEQSYEDDTLKASIFSFYFCEAVNNGHIKLEEISKYIDFSDDRQTPLAMSVGSERISLVEKDLKREKKRTSSISKKIITNILQIENKFDLSILYFYDIQYDKNNEDKLGRLRDSLIKKILIQNKKIDIIVFSGNLVKDITKDSLKDAYIFFIEPIRKELKINSQHICFTIGSQDINLEKRDKYRFKGLSSELYKKNNKESIKDLLNGDIELEEVVEYMDFLNFLGDEKLHITQLYNIKKIKINDIVVGIVSLNSTLFINKKKLEAKKLWLPKLIFTYIYKELNDCTIKILNMYHPFNWFINQFELEQEALDRFNIVFYANKNNNYNGKSIQDYNNSDVLILDVLSLNNPKLQNGYSCFFYDIGASEIKILNTSYTKQQVFENLEPKLFKDIDLTKKAKNTIRNKVICSKLVKKVRDEINKFLTINLTSYSNKKDIEEIFIVPKIIKKKRDTEEKSISTGIDIFYENKKSQEHIFTIEELIESKDDILLLGNPNSGKTTLLNYINIKILINYSLHIPIYMDGNILSELTIRGFESKIHDYLDNHFEDVNNLNIKQLLKEKRFLFLIDNLSKINKNLLSKIINLENRIIATSVKKSSDEIKSVLKNLNHHENNFIFKELEIQSFQKNDCFMLTKNIVSIDISEQISKHVYKTIMDMNLPFNPFIATLLSWMYMDKIEVKESEPALIEVFLDYILEKSELSKKFQGKFDFADKIDLLSEIAYEFYMEKSFAIKENLVSEIIIKYINKYELAIKLDTLLEYFYDRKLFIKNKEMTMFSYRVFYFYFISKYMESNDNFTASLLSDKVQVVNMSEELRYYASIKRNDIVSVEKVFKYIKDNKYTSKMNQLLNQKKYIINRKKIIDLDNLIDEGNVELEIDSIGEKKEELENKFSTKRDNYIDSHNTKLKKDIEVLTDREEYIALNIILAEFIKKLKIGSNEKEKYFLFLIDNFTNVLKLLSSKRIVRRFIKNKLKSENAQVLLEEMSLKTEVDIKNTFEKNTDEIVDTIVSMLTSLISTDALTALATPKLIKLYEKNFEKEVDSYKMLFYCLLLIEIDSDNIIKISEKFISLVNNNTLLQLLFSSLVKNYQERTHTSKKKEEIKKVLKNILSIQQFGTINKKMQVQVNKELYKKVNELLESQKL